MTRRGFALAAVLFALVLLAAASAAGFFASLQDARAGRNAVSLVRADAAASSSIASIIAGWDPRIMNVLLPGEASVPSVTPIPGVGLDPLVRRLGERLFLIRVAATHADASRTSMAIVRLRGLEVERAAARVRHVDPVLAPFISGVDAAPPGWSCPATSDTIPAVLVQPGASDSVLFRFGDRDWARMVAWVTAVAPGGDSLPLRYEPGSVAIAGSRVLGLMIVEGDLTLSMGAQVVGTALVRGSLILEAGGTVHGAVVASQLVAGTGFMASGPVVSYSSCVVLRTGLSRALPEPLPGLPEVRFY